MVYTRSFFTKKPDENTGCKQCRKTEQRVYNRHNSINRHSSKHVSIKIGIRSQHKAYADSAAYHCHIKSQYRLKFENG